MPEPLKNIYSPSFFEKFTASVKKQVPQFRKQRFLNEIFDQQWEHRELKQRVQHIAAVLGSQLPGSYAGQVGMILRLIEQLRKEGTRGGFEYMILPEFVRQAGLDEPGISLDAMEQITQFISCEFAIRPFLLRYPDRVMKRMLRWSLHPHDHVRRLASEGCRPRLPWGESIPQFKKDPSPILPILENLKDDPSVFVRKSVANNLNDIAKDHPGVVAQVARDWKGASKETDWIIRHGCRGLLKKADSSIYQIFGLDGNTACKVSGFRLSKTELRIGERLGFSFNLKTTEKKSARLRLEYAVYYLKSNGRLNRKLFKLADNHCEPGHIYSFKKEQRFQDFSTRKHYPGKHRISIVVNGTELVTRGFLLLDQE